MKRFPSVAAAAALVLALGAADAKVVVQQNYTTNFLFSAIESGVPLWRLFVPPTGEFKDIYPVSFSITTPGTYLVTYSAECAVDAPAGNRLAYVDIDLVIDGAAVVPTAGGGDVFCAANGLAGYDGWMRASVTAGVFLAAGSHTLTLNGRLHNAALGAWLGDGAVLIHQ